MADLSTDWELVSRKARDGSPGVLSVLHSMLVRDPSEAAQPFTWTLRHRITGRVRKLTARTELEARVKIANGLFEFGLGRVFTSAMLRMSLPKG